MLSKRIFVLVSLLLVSFLLVGCGTTPPIVDNHAPEITSTAKTEATVGVEYTYDVNANDPDGDALTYSLTRNPSLMSIDEDTGLITWEHPTVGSHGVTVKVSDGVLSDTQPFTVTVTGVVELTGITVDPDTMALEAGGTGTFTVTASYSFGDSKDVTNACDYTQPTTGVVTVETPLVTAVKAGTDTIFISYTEGDITATANIAVTISGVRIPMTITVDLPTFTVAGPYWFTIEMIANDDSGKSVIASFDWPTSTLGVKIAGTLETDVGSEVTFALVGDTFRTDPFLMEGITTVNFRGTFDEVGTYSTTIEVRTSPDGDLLCSLPITIVVEVAPLKVGDSYEGGIIAYILQSNDTGYDADIQHGLIVATEDQSESIVWATENYQSTLVPGGTLFTIGSGFANTEAIIAQNGVGNTYAAGLARAYNGGSFNDWFLPSKDELNKLWLNRGLIGNFTDDGYWSSSEYNTNSAWNQNFNDGKQDGYFKNSTYKVRAVRAF